MTDMTVQQHVEQLVLEKAQMQAQYEAHIGTIVRVITALMGKNRTRKLTPEQWQKTLGTAVQFRNDDDGGVVINILKESPNGKVESAQGVEE